jgi:hypothetical protein
MCAINNISIAEKLIMAGNLLKRLSLLKGIAAQREGKIFQGFNS